VNVELAAELAEANSAKAALETQAEELQSSLQAQIDALKAEAELGGEYRKDLIEQALEAGVRLQGNLFPSESYGKFLETLSVPELKEVIADFAKGFDEKFEGVQYSKSGEPGQKDSRQYRQDFEDDTEYRDYIAGLAPQYAAEQGVSLAEATKTLYAKYLKEVSE